MIKDKNQSKIDNESNNIKLNNQKGLFQISSNNSSSNYTTIISSPGAIIENKQKIKLNFSNKNSDIFYKNQNNLFQNHFFENKNNKNEVNMIIQKSYINEFGNSLDKNQNIINNNINEKKKEKEICPIGLVINDKFFDLLVNIYKNEGIEIGYEDEDSNSIIIENEKENDNFIKEKSFKINSNIYNNKEDNNNEQISCICLKSKCLNNYCSCHKNGIMCNKNCRCLNCDNFDNNNTISSNELQNNISKYKKTKFFSL